MLLQRRCSIPSTAAKRVGRKRREVLQGSLRAGTQRLQRSVYGLLPCNQTAVVGPRTHPTRLRPRCSAERAAGGSGGRGRKRKSLVALEEASSETTGRDASCAADGTTAGECISAFQVRQGPGPWGGRSLPVAAGGGSVCCSLHGLEAARARALGLKLSAALYWPQTSARCKPQTLPPPPHSTTPRPARLPP